MKISKVVIALSLVAMVSASGMVLAAGKKKNTMQFVYQAYAYNGKGYGETFVPQREDSLHLIAGVSNVITPKVADVAWSEESGEWMADWSNWDHPAKDAGDRLQVIEGGKVKHNIGKITVCMYYPDANATDVSKLLSGQAAEAKFAQFQKETDLYYAASSAYEALQAQVEELKKQPGAAIPALPAKPEAPKYSVSQPMQAFIVNLKRGSYTIRTLDKDGSVIKDSQKTLVAFKFRRIGIGYEIKPETKWTYPVQNNDRTNIIYYVGKSELFFTPNTENEYNVRDFTKLMRPNSPMSNNAPKDMWDWVQVSKKEGTSLKLLKNGKPYQEIKEQPWIVVQTPGSALGYNIEEWIPGKSKETQPHFRAHKVVLSDKGSFEIRLVGADGKIDPSGDRQARPIKDINSAILFIIALVPFAFGVIVSAVRAAKTRSQFKGTSA